MRNRIIAIICCIPLTLSLPIDPLIHKFKSEIKHKELEVPKIVDNSLIKVLKQKYKFDKQRELQQKLLLHKEKMRLLDIEVKRLEEQEARKKEQQEIKNQNTYENKMRSVENKSTTNTNSREVTFNLTFYDACYSCTQNTSNPGKTASGVYAKQGITVAAPSNIPFGTKIQIGNNTFIVHDRGGAIVNANGMIHIDVYVNTHEQALRLGRKIVKGYILN